jgi:hypothetical protein
MSLFGCEFERPTNMFNIKKSVGEIKKKKKISFSKIN